MIVITGPTGGGKSAAGLALADRIGGEIVSCDSLQVFRGFDIGSAKPTPQERDRVPHHLVDVVDPDEPFSAADWARLARTAIRDIEERGRIPIVVGGTGLYLRALLDGIFDGPQRNEEVRARLERIADRKGNTHLHNVLRRLDPTAASRIAAQDRIRMVRALEVRLLSGRSISEQQTQWRGGRPERRGLVLGIDPGREELRHAIERRCDAMLEAGLVAEVRGLVHRWGAEIRPLRAIGYRQILEFLRGELSLDEARNRMAIETFRFAKRQRTWFRHQTPPDAWFANGESLVEAAPELRLNP